MKRRPHPGIELTEHEREALARVIADAIDDHDDEDSSDDPNESEGSEADRAARAARVEQEEAAYRRFKSEAGVSDLPPLDQRRISEDALRAIDRRRQRKEAQLKSPNVTSGRLARLERELEELDELESAHFRLLHPPTIGSVFGGPGIRADQIASPPRAYCRYCGRELSAEEAFEHGRVCRPCRVAFAVAHDRTPPTN